MALTAADPQKRHELEGAPDPFPPVPSPNPVTPSPSQLDTDTDSAFPSLVSTTSLVAPNPPRFRPSIVSKPVFTDSFTISAIDLSGAGKDGKPATLGGIMKQVMAKYKVKIEASANQKARQTTFHVKADTQKELDKAKKSLLALLSPVVTLVIQAPASTIAFIIGPKGATLKQIRDQTSVRVDIPPRDTTTVPNGHSHPNGSISGKATPAVDDSEEPTVPVTLTGPQPLVYEAQELLNQIISSRPSKSTQRVRDIPAHVLPFVLARRSAFLAAATDGWDINLSLNAPLREITVSGDRDSVVAVINVIKNTVEAFTNNLASSSVYLPKRQHRLLVGKAVDDIMAETKCSVVVADHDDPSDEVVIWGQSVDLPAGRSAVFERANSQYIHEFPLPGPIATSRQIIAYMIHIQYAKVLTAANPGISVFLPTPAAIERGQTLNIDLVGEKASVDAGVRGISELIGKLIGATRELSIDWLVHRIIIGKHGKKLKQFHDIHNVQVIFPNESDEKSSVVLVYDPLFPSASPLPDEKKRNLDDVEKELLKLAKDAADVKTEKISVDVRWHDVVGGQVNTLIGEDRALSIKVGAEVGDSSTNDVILVRGPSADVDKAVQEISKIVDMAKNEEIMNSYFTEFDIDREYVGRIVGAHGAGVNKLREELGVRLDVFDDVEDKDGKKKKVVHQRSKVKLTGRREKVEEGKKRILAQVERLADETSEVLKIPSQYHSSLIGQSGKYAIRLEEKYSVKITFPRQSGGNGEGKTREPLKPDEVLIKGGKKGVAGAKSELLDALEFEKETNNVLNFTVPNRCVARILGKGGATINEIKDNTETQIDLERVDNGEHVTNITVRGTKKAIAAAKAAILAIAEQIVEETTVTVLVENKFHRNLIGAGGQGLKELITTCGGPSDPKLQSGLIRFPRQGEPSDEVKLRGEPRLVNKLKIELEKAVAILRDRVILAVEIPAAQHRALIGRGGQHLIDLQTKRNVQIQFPGSRSYNQVGKPENATDFTDVDVANVVKVAGSRAACEAAIEELKGHVKPPPAEAITATVPVPLKYHHAISQQGNFFRTLRSFGVNIDQSLQPSKPFVSPKPTSANGHGNATPTARIDEAALNEGSTEVDIHWEVVENYQDAEDGESIWTLKARDQPGLQRAQKLIQDTVDHAARMTHVGFLTLPDRSVFPRIIGSKGANVARLRNETEADITVSRDSNIIVITGSESAISAAKIAIVKVASTPGRAQRRSDHEDW